MNIKTFERALNIGIYEAITNIGREFVDKALGMDKSNLNFRIDFWNKHKEEIIKSIVNAIDKIKKDFEKGEKK